MRTPCDGGDAWGEPEGSVLPGVTRVLLWTVDRREAIQPETKGDKSDFSDETRGKEESPHQPEALSDFPSYNPHFTLAEWQSVPPSSSCVPRNLRPHI